MTREQLIKILNDNGVRYDSDIEKEATEGFVNDECAACADKLYTDLYKMAVYGVQNGFNKCEDDIYGLTKLIASLVSGTSRKAVNLTKTAAKRQQILKGASYLKREIDMDMLNQLTENLNACIAAADAIITIRQDNAALTAKLTESKSVLEEIKETLSHAADVTSKNAAQYQVKIFEALMDWRDAVSRYNCYSDTVDGLKVALEAAKEWQQLSATVRKSAKRNVDYYEYHADCDDIGLIINAARFAERTDGMREHLADFRNQTALLYGVEELRKEFAARQEEYLKSKGEMSERLAEIEKETDAAIFAFRNGEQDEITTNMQLDDLDDEKARLEDELAELQGDFDEESEDMRYKLRDAQDGSRVREKIAKNFESFVKRIEAYRSTDPAMFVILCERINFNGVYDTLTNRLTDGEVDEVYTSVETVIRETEEDLKRQRKNLSGYERITDRMRENRRAEEKILREQERARRERIAERKGESRNPSSALSREEARKKLEERIARRVGTAVPSDQGGEETPNRNGNINNEDK